MGCGLWGRTESDTTEATQQQQQQQQSCRTDWLLNNSGSQWSPVKWDPGLLPAF